MPRKGLHINLEGFDVGYEALFVKIYGTKKEARIHGGHRSYLSNVAHTYYNCQPQGLPPYQDQLKAIIKYLQQAIDKLFTTVPERMKYALRKHLLSLQHIQTHQDLYPIIRDLNTLLDYNS